MSRNVLSSYLRRTNLIALRNTRVERDRARDAAVALEQELAEVRDLLRKIFWTSEFVPERVTLSRWITEGRFR